MMIVEFKYSNIIYISFLIFRLKNIYSVNFYYSFTEGKKYTYYWI
jgi:hypothetical protein